MKPAALLLATLLLLASCRPSPAVMPTATPLPTQTPQPTTTQVPPMATAVPPTPTAIPTAEPTTGPAVVGTPWPERRSGNNVLSVASGKVYLNGNLLVDSGLPPEVGFDPILYADFSPSGDHVAVVTWGVEMENPLYLFRSDGSGGGALTGGEKGMLNGANFDWSSDGRYLYYYRIDSMSGLSTAPTGIIRHDTLTGQERALAPWAYTWSFSDSLDVSPDDRWIALLQQYAPYVLAADGSSLWRLAGECNSVSWREDSAGILSLMCKNDGGSVSPLEVRQEEGSARALYGSLDFTEFATQQAFFRPACGSSYRVSSDQPVQLFFGAWGAKDLAQALDNARHLSIELWIDGQKHDAGQRAFTPASSIPCGDVTAGSSWIVHGIQLEKLDRGTHTVTVTLRFDQDVTDGFDSNGDGVPDSYKADEPIRQTCTILAD